MSPFGSLGKILIICGVVLVVLGVILILGDKIPWVGRLPGDIIIKRDKFTFYFPLMTSIIISLLLTLFFYLFRK
jgi:di/tricarboxylate transporter